MSRKRLLFITPWPPSGRGSGGQVVSGALLQIYQAKFDVDVIAGFGRGYDKEDRPEWGVVEWVPLRLQHRMHPLYGRAMAVWSWLRGRSLRSEKMVTQPMREAVNRALQRTSYDLIHVDMTLMRGVVPNSVTPIIVSAQNVEPEIFKRMAERARGLGMRCAARLEATRVLHAERRAIETSDAVISMSQRDAVVLRRLHRTSDPAIVPVYPPIQEHPAILSSPPEEKSILLLGSLAAPGRLEGTMWFVEYIWPIVQQSIREATLHIAGSGPPEYLRRLSGKNGIRVHGFVDDLTGILRSTRVLAVPLRVGGGIRIKILEMMNLGIPVVTTTVGAMGLRRDTLSHLALEDDPAQFAVRVLDFLRDDTRWIEHAAAGRSHVRDAYSTGTAAQALDTAVHAALTARARGSR